MEKNIKKNEIEFKKELSRWFTRVLTKYQHDCCPYNEIDDYAEEYLEEASKSLLEKLNPDSLSNDIICDTCKEKHEYVDLGLPSGTLWATENIKDAEGNELYFAWGETTGYTKSQVGIDKNFTWDDYKFGSSSPFSKYDEDGKTVLESVDDAAFVNWGSDWRIPNKEEWRELIDNTKHKKTSDYNGTGIAGIICISIINGNTLFFPHASIVGQGKVKDDGIGGYCWSSSLGVYDFSRAWGMLSNDVCRYFGDYCFRSNGYSIRPIKIKQ